MSIGVSIREPVAKFLSNKFIYNGALLSIGVALVAVFTFVRSLVLARGISLEDFGIATALLTSMSLVQMATAIAGEKQVLQDEDGGTDQFLAAVHTLAVIRGLFCGVLMFFASGPISSFFGLSDVLWAFQVVALGPVIAGFTHYDYSAMQRQSNHKAAVFVSTMPDVLVTMLTLPAVVIWPDYRAIFLACLGWPLIRCILSHTTSQRPYRLSMNPTLVGKLLKFSWPLMLSGLLLFLVFHGDRAVVGHYFSMHELGFFSLVLTAFLLPSQLLHKVYDSLFLSSLSKAFRHRDRFESQQFLIWHSLFALSTAYVLFSILLGPWLFIFLFGEKYEPGLEVLPWIVLMVSVRILRIATSMLALATAKPYCELYANLVRASALPIAIIGLAMGYPIECVPIAGIIGEVLALFVGLVSLNLPVSHAVKPPAVSGMIMLWLASMVFITAEIVIDINPPYVSATLAAVLLITMILFFIKQYPKFTIERGFQNDV